MTSVQAWLMDLGPFRIAVSYRDVVEVVAEPLCWPLPIGPRWCRELLGWRGRYLPLARLGLSTEAPFAIVVAVTLERHPARTEYVALRLRHPPQLIQVGEEDDCEPPLQMPLPAEHVLACFKREAEVVLVPNLAALFNITQTAAV